MLATNIYIRKILGELRMAKFKKGDKVVKKASISKGEWDNYPYVTVDKVDTDGSVWVEETKTYCLQKNLELYDDVQDKRDKLEAAIRLVQSYKIGVNVLDDRVYIMNRFSSELSIGEVLDELLPLETPQQKKLKELEVKQREIADQMEQIRSLL